MKILFITDTHGSNLPRKEVDLVLHCGDFTTFESNMKQILLNFEKYPSKVFLIHGNHEDENNVKRLIKELKLKNVKFIHNKVVKFKSLTIAAIGGGGFSYNFPTTRKIEKKLSKEKRLDIFITHAPPYGTELDRLGFDYVGNIEFREFIEKYQPKIAACGHLHENELKQDKIGKTLIINPGPKGIIFEL